jgi:hypothetical protein
MEHSEAEIETEKFCGYNEFEFSCVEFFKRFQIDKRQLSVTSPVELSTVFIYFLNVTHF